MGYKCIPLYLMLLYSLFTLSERNNSKFLQQIVVYFETSSLVANRTSTAVIDLKVASRINIEGSSHCGAEGTVLEIS